MQTEHQDLHDYIHTYIHTYQIEQLEQQRNTPHAHTHKQTKAK